jgi:hypothetical protein
MNIGVTVVLQFMSTKYSSPVEAEKAIQAALMADELDIADLRHDPETRGFRTIVCAEGFDQPSAE